MLSWVRERERERELSLHFTRKSERAMAEAIPAFSTFLFLPYTTWGEYDASELLE